MNPIPEVDFTDSARLAQRATIFWGNIGGVLAFTTLLSLGIAFRSNAYVHRRMMLFASISFVSPAVGRVAGWLAETGISLAMFNNSVILSLILAVLLYELVADRRVHLITRSSPFFAVNPTTGCGGNR